MKTYNGHRSWSAWSIALTMGNDEPIYRFAMQCLNDPPVNRNKKGLAHAVSRFMLRYGGLKTPEGAPFNRLGVKLCLESFME